MPLLRQADEWESTHDGLSRQNIIAARAAAESPDFWRGAAGAAMRGRHTRATTAATTVQTALAEAVAAARRGGQVIGDASTTVLRAIDNAELGGYQLSDNGTATVTPEQKAAALTLGFGRAETALMYLERGAQMHTIAVVNALIDLGTADSVTAAAIEAAFRSLPGTKQPADIELVADNIREQKGDKGGDGGKEPPNQANRKPHRKGKSKSTKNKHEKADRHGGEKKWENPNKRRHNDNFHITPKELEGAAVGAAILGAIVGGIVAGPPGAVAGAAIGAGA